MPEHRAGRWLVVNYQYIHSSSPRPPATPGRRTPPPMGIARLGATTAPASRRTRRSRLA